MSESASKRRMIENEVVFRQHNERVQKKLVDLKHMAKEHDQEHMLPDDDIPLHFYCECSDENCRKRIVLKPSIYNKIHKRRDRFVIICGHQTENIEKVIGEKSDFCIVEKFITPPESADGLNKTDVDNS